MTDPTRPDAPPAPEDPGGAPAVKPRAKRPTLPRELADFLIEFSIALHKHAMYPGGHPTLAPAAEGVVRRLETLLAERGKLSLGVARDQLIIEGVATDPRNPVLKDLADRLHRHHLGAVSFNRGVTPDELEAALKLIALDADRGADPIGLRPRAEIPRWPHLEIYPLTFDRLELVGSVDGENGESGPGVSVTGGRGALLWVGLARAALAADELHRPSDQKPEPKPPEPHAFRPVPVAASSVPLSDSEIDAALSEVKAGDIEHETVAEPTAVAKAIEAHERGTAYDQVIVGYLLQIADELKTAGGAGAVALKKKMSRLITSLDQNTLGRLVDMGGDTRQRRQFVLDASQGMAVDAVVDLVQAASGTGAPISNAMMRMLRKLSQHAERGPAARRTMADSALREQVAELVQGWALADPNPDGYAAALQKMSMAAPVLVTAEEEAYAPEPDRMVKMAIESGGVGGALERAVGEFVQGNRITELLGLLDQAPRENPATQVVRGRFQDPDMLRAALAQVPVKMELVDQLLEALGPRAVEPMLDMLNESESRQVRRALIDRLIRMGPWVRPVLQARLADERWYVQRNMLYIAAELPGLPLALDATPLRQHADARVRREALRVLFRSAEERTRAICTALADQDPKMKRLALNAVVEGGTPEAAVPQLVSLISDEELDAELRIGAIKALGTQGGRIALDALLKLTQVRRRSIIEFVAQSTAGPEVLAAVTALRSFRTDPRARERLTTLASGRDETVAEAAAAALREEG
ncbi:MAG: HEAT repeat domain-containing protein [Gemmatimonadales bacterium]